MFVLYIILFFLLFTRTTHGFLLSLLYTHKIDYATYGINVTHQIGIDSDTNKPVYRTILGSNSISLSTNVYSTLGNLFGSGTGTVETIYKLDGVLRNSSNSLWCTGTWDSGTEPLGTKNIALRVYANGDVQIATKDESFGAAKVRVVVEWVAS